MKIFRIAQGFITLYRGENTTNRGGSNIGKYYSTDKEWAKQFTQTGQVNEVKSIQIPKSSIYIKDPLPLATEEQEFDECWAYAKQNGYKAFMVNEGVGEPNSVFVVR